MPILAPSDKPWSCGAAAAAAVADDVAANELITEFGSAIEREDVVFAVVELEDAELSRVVLVRVFRVVSSMVCWYAVIVVPDPVRQPYEKKE